MTKKCKTCKEIKPIGEFYVHRTGKHGVVAHCKSCYPKSQRNHAEYLRLYRYGLTVEKYQELVTEQGGRCATCGETPEKLYVDHDHMCCPGAKTCGECVRGLLCLNCNTALGQIKDDPRILFAMIQYLESNDVT